MHTGSSLSTHMIITSLPCHGRAGHMLTRPCPLASGRLPKSSQQLQACLHGPYTAPEFSIKSITWITLFMVASNTDEGARAPSIALRTFENLGVPVASHKTEGPWTCIAFLGIFIDTGSFELRLPTKKIVCIRALLQSWIHKRACMRRELESLLGHLSHATSVVRPGCTFVGELLCEVCCSEDVTVKWLLTYVLNECSLLGLRYHHGLHWYLH